MPASKAAQEPGGRYGDLSPLAGPGLTSQASRTEAAKEVRRLASTASARSGGAAAPQAVADRPISSSSPVTAFLRENPAYSSRASAPESSESIEHDGRDLREAQAELRGLRADVAELARVLGRPLRSSSTLTEYRGVLQTHDQLDSDTQREWFEAERSQASSPRRELASELRQVEARQLLRKQEQLLQALRRAHLRLDEAPELVLPPGVREAVIGEILRARYSAAVFGGLAGSASIGGMLANQVY